MNEYTTTDGGIKVSRSSTGGLKVHYVDDNVTDADDRYVPGFAAAALGEFFQVERDEALGRWRWPENPDVTVRIAPKHAQHGVSDDTVMIQSDESGYVGYYTRERLPEITDKTGDIVRAGHAYFDAHPEPKPWHDAKFGEVWLLRFEADDNEFAAFQYGDGRWKAIEGGFPNADLITSGRRIWPEVSA